MNNKTKIIVLDFDKTCIKVQSVDKMPSCKFHPLWLRVYEKEDLDIDSNPELKISSDDIFPDTIECIKKIFDSNAIVIIGSYGSKCIIKKCFIDLGIIDNIKEIITPIDFELPEFHEMKTKTIMLDYIKNKYNVDDKNICLVDDSLKHIINADKSGYSSIYSPDGIDKNIIELIEKFIT